jgi:hypothetical protein
MFGSKKDTSHEIIGEPVGARIQVIPADFYAGQNPIVTFKDVSKEVVLNQGATVSMADKRMLDKQTAPGSGEALHPANLLGNPRFLVLAGVGLLVLFGGTVSLYYWFQSKSTSPAQVPVIATPLPENPVPQAPVEVTVPTSTEPVVSPAPVSLADQPLTFPSSLLGDSPDTDKDGLTDREEDLFTTDPNVPDTDGDSYSDSHEIFYLYNPAGKEPEKLLDSGLVKEYTNPNFGYKLYYPASWAIGDVDGTYRDVLFSTLTGENIEVRVFDKEATIDFDSWFQTHAPDQKFGDLVKFDGYFKNSGLRRADSLVYYFPTANHVYAFIYHTTDSSIINYRSVLKVFARSFIPRDDAAVTVPVFNSITTITVPNTADTSTVSTSTPGTL